MLVNIKYTYKKLDKNVDGQIEGDEKKQRS